MWRSPMAPGVALDVNYKHKALPLSLLSQVQIVCGDQHTHIPPAANRSAIFGLSFCFSLFLVVKKLSTPRACRWSSPRAATWRLICSLFPRGRGPTWYCASTLWTIPWLWWPAQLPAPPPAPRCEPGEREKDFSGTDRRITVCFR